MKKFYICNCCGFLVIINKQDDISKYKCQACEIMNCKDGKLEKITKEEFYKEIES